MISTNILVEKTIEADYTLMFARPSLYVHGRVTVF